MIAYSPELDLTTAARAYSGSIDAMSPWLPRVTSDGKADTAPRAIMFTDIDGSKDVSTIHGDEAALDLVRRHDAIARQAIGERGGRIDKHTGDGVLASFTSVLRAAQLAIAIQTESAAAVTKDPSWAVKIGVTEGEPVEYSDDLFGAAVNLAARICAHAAGGQTLVSGAVRDLAIGKGIAFRSVGETASNGFPDPVPLYDLV